MKPGRFLVTTADDYGIGAATSKGILDLAVAGIVKSSVLLVNSPFAEEAVQSWQRAGQPMELGWHPCLTLDRPVSGPEAVTSLVQPDGSFWPLGKFLQRLFLGRICPQEMERELRAQHSRFIELIGHPPSIVNSHHHVQVFEPVGTILIDILCEQRPLPYLRRIREPLATLWHVPGAELKRMMLCAFGARAARLQRRAGLPGNEMLAGITNPPVVADPHFLRRWLMYSRGNSVELTCHPGHTDPSLVGRDCTLTDGQLERRVREFELLHDPDFTHYAQRMGFSLASGLEITTSASTSYAHAA